MKQSSNMFCYPSRLDYCFVLVVSFLCRSFVPSKYSFFECVHCGPRFGVLILAPNVRRREEKENQPRTHAMPLWCLFGAYKHYLKSLLCSYLLVFCLIDFDYLILRLVLWLVVCCFDYLSQIRCVYVVALFFFLFIFIIIICLMSNDSMGFIPFFHHHSSTPSWDEDLLRISSLRMQCLNRSYDTFN